ncbi:hypothetical protein DFH06DRAFT_1150067 [Mycena polygramma]|nr:hypothetical protein DFH06DRAFT_1150067 [Mycena polygramma]
MRPWSAHLTPVGTLYHSNNASGIRTTISETTSSSTVTAFRAPVSRASADPRQQRSADLGVDGLGCPLPTSDSLRSISLLEVSLVVFTAARARAEFGRRKQKNSKKIACNELKLRIIQGGFTCGKPSAARAPRWDKASRTGESTLQPTNRRREKGLAAAHGLVIIPVVCAAVLAPGGEWCAGDRGPLASPCGRARLGGGDRGNSPSACHAASLGAGVVACDRHRCSPAYRDGLLKAESTHIVPGCRYRLAQETGGMDRREAQLVESWGVERVQSFGCSRNRCKRLRDDGRRKADKEASINWHAVSVVKGTPRAHHRQFAYSEGVPSGMGWRRRQTDSVDAKSTEVNRWSTQVDPDLPTRRRQTLPRLIGRGRPTSTQANRPCRRGHGMQIGGTWRQRGGTLAAPGGDVAVPWRQSHSGGNWRRLFRVGSTEFDAVGGSHSKPVSLAALPPW